MISHRGAHYRQNKKGDTLQTGSPSNGRPQHGGIALYKNILQEILNANPDNVTKVVDENGEPMVVYHGSLSKNITAFDPGKVGSRYSYDEEGFFFTSSKKLGEDYAHSVFSDRYGRVYEVFLDAKHPLIVNDRYARKNRYGQTVSELDAIGFWDLFQTPLLEEYAEGNHDSIIVDDGMNKMIVVFNPNQIKSATDNAGTFSNENNDIRFSVAKPVQDETTPIPQGPFPSTFLCNSYHLISWIYFTN